MTRNAHNLRLRNLHVYLESLQSSANERAAILRQSIQREISTDCTHNAVKSLEILRQLVQPLITTEIVSILDKYVVDFFAPAIENVKANDISVNDDVIDVLKGKILDSVRQMFGGGAALAHKRSASGVRSTSAMSATSNGVQQWQQQQQQQQLQQHLNVASTSGLSNYSINNNTTRQSINPQSVNQSSSVEYFGYANSGEKRIVNATPLKKRKFVRLNSGSAELRRERRKLPQTSGSRQPPHLMNLKGNASSVGSEIPPWNAARITDETQFVLGSRANKLLGLAQRGRIYAKHPRLFRYVGDNDDKSWLTQSGHASRTAGKTYLLIADDVRALAPKNGLAAAVQRYAFVLPKWMLDKVRARMSDGCQWRRMRHMVRHSVSDTAAILHRLEESQNDGDDDDPSRSADATPTSTSTPMSVIQATGGQSVTA